MSAIPAQYRRAASEAEFVQRVHKFGLVPAYKIGPAEVPVLMVLIPGVSHPSDFSRVVTVSPEEWVKILNDIKTPRGLVSLRIVQDTRDPRHFGVAWTDAGRAARNDSRYWGDKGTKELRRAQRASEDRIRGSSAGRIRARR